MYNFSTAALGAESAAVAQKLQDAGKWGAEKFSKDPARLCTGTAATCPTPKLNVAASRHDELVAKGSAAVQALKDMLAAGSSELPPEIADFAPRLADVPEDMRNYVVDGVPDDRWEHKCAGLLKTMAGCDIVWVSCSGFVASKATMKRLGLESGLPAEMTAQTEAPDSAQGDESGLKPLTDADKNAMRALRLQTYKDTKVGGEMTVRASQELVVLGSDYAGNIENTLKRQDDYVEGKAKKVGFVGKLKTLKVTEIPGSLKDRVQGVFNAVMTDSGDDPSMIEFK